MGKLEQFVFKEEEMKRKFNKENSYNTPNVINSNDNVAIKKYHEYISNHKKIIDIIKEYTLKYENEMKHKEEILLKKKEAKDSQLKKSKKLNNKMNLGSLTQGIFLDTLNDNCNDLWMTVYIRIFE
jgi:hypothetical protein